MTASSTICIASLLFASSHALLSSSRCCYTSSSLPCASRKQPCQLQQSQRTILHRHHGSYYLPSTRTTTTSRYLAANNDLDDGGEMNDEQHLHGIGVGIDLGTTNSAVAMMVPVSSEDGGDGSRRTLPAMIEIANEGRTIPSVVAFVPSSTSVDDDANELSLPPWVEASSELDNHDDIQWPTSSSSDNPYQIYTGKQAIEHEQYHPNSSYRNIKRIIGTGGKMAELASGLVPNLYIKSVHGNTDSTDDGLDALFDMLEESDNTKKRNKGKKKKKKKKKNKSKWKKRKESELPKLQKQLENAKHDPALLTCNIFPTTDTNEGGEEVLLRPEQISACILRKLYDTAELYHKANNDDEGKEVRVTRAVIGVPAYFTEAQRQATMLASELAGVPKVKLLPEPEAAALAYGSDSGDSSKSGSQQAANGGSYDDKEELILVFDLGGGTFDVSILEVGGGVTEVLATVGNNRLGGTDFDKRVAEYLSQCAVEFGRKRKVDKKLKKSDNVDSLDGLEDDAMDSSNRKQKRRRPIKDWYRHGSGEVPNIILRVAEEARKCLSNQKVVEVLVPLTEEGWRQVGGGIGDDEAASDRIDLQGSVIGPFDKDKLDSEQGMIEGEDYTIVSLDRKVFESICYNELQLLLQPIREVAIMAGVLLPGEARPSFVENAMELALAREEAMDDEYGEDFWDLEIDEDDVLDSSDDMLIKTGKDGAPIDSISSPQVEEKEEALDDQALEQIQLMDIKAQKKAQQRGRKKARDIDKRERSFRKQKQSAMQDATEASLLGKQLGGGKKSKGGGAGAAVAAPLPTSVSVGNERVQEGIHGRPLSRIVLVGGATRMPVIAKLLEAVVGMVPQRTVNPDEAVALGCAVQVGILDGENEGLLGGMQAVLSPMQAAVMRALAKKRGMSVMENGELTMEGDFESGEEMEMMLAGGISGLVVDEFDDEDDFY